MGFATELEKLQLSEMSSDDEVAGALPGGFFELAGQHLSIDAESRTVYVRSALFFKWDLLLSECRPLRLVLELR